MLASKSKTMVSHIDRDKGVVQINVLFLGLRVGSFRGVGVGLIHTVSHFISDLICVFWAWEGYFRVWE